MSSEPITYVRVGYLVKKNNDTLRGYIKMVLSYYEGQTIKDVPLLPFDKTDKKDIINVDLDEIDHVRISSPKGTTSEDYMPVRSAMWQILGRKGQISVCTQTWGTIRPYTYYQEMVLVSGKKLIEIPINPSNSGAYHPRFSYLVQFINKRYGRNFTTKSFKGRDDMVSYILDNENEAN
ncbi:MAG TPA: hypothetical protein VK518_05445 [Puia sp.]|nr:hypothetical protein [Puia sp.]